MANPSFATQELYACVSVEMKINEVGGQEKSANATVLADLLGYTLQWDIECQLLTQNERGLIFLAFVAGLQGAVTFVDINGVSSQAVSVFGSYRETATPADGDEYYDVSFSIELAESVI